MFNIDKVQVRAHVPYSEMITFAKKVVDQICGSNERETLNAVGAEYMYYAGLVCLFTNVRIKEIEEDIDGFMEEIYKGETRGNLISKITDAASKAEREAFERAVKRGVERYYAKPQIDRVLDNVNGLLGDANKLVKLLGGMDQDKLMEAIGVIISKVAAQ